MKPIFIIFLLNSIFISLSFASSTNEQCKIEGMQNAPQAITCEYRDGWYIKMFQRIRCINGSYQYQIDTHSFTNVDSGKMVTASTKGNHRGKPIIQFINTDGLALELTPFLGKMYHGKFYWYENTYSSYDNEAHCKIIK